MLCLEKSQSSRSGTALLGAAIQNKASALYYLSFFFFFPYPYSPEIETDPGAL